MAYHQKVLSNVRGKTDLYQIKEGHNFQKMFSQDNDKLFDEQQIILNMCLHSSDVSNPAKPEHISKAWTTRVYDEFFKQGELEKEKGLPISLLCDRKTTDINKAMIGFINFVVMPSMDMLCNLIPEIRFYSENVRINLRYYIKEVEISNEADKESSDSDSNSNSNSGSDSDSENEKSKDK